MTRMIKQKKTINKSLKNTENQRLSIQFSLDGFSFCIENRQQKVTHFSTVLFDATLATPKELLLKIEAVFNQNHQLQQDFSSVLAIHQNSLSTLVPTSFFDENKLKMYLQYNIKTLATDFIAFDDVLNIDAKNVYVPYVNINNYLFQNFGEFEYKHHLSILLEKLIHHNTNTSEKRMFVNLSKNNLDIIVLESGNLFFCNSFSYTTKEDFIYYILFTAEQLQLNTEKFLLTFLGDINIDDAFYKIAYQYIRNIQFYKSKNQVYLDKNLPKHSNFILLG